MNDRYDFIEKYYEPETEEGKELKEIMLEISEEDNE